MQLQRAGGEMEMENVSLVCLCGLTEFDPVLQEDFKSSFQMFALKIEQ